jgi:bacillolysin
MLPKSWFVQVILLICFLLNIKSNFKTKIMKNTLLTIIAALGIVSNAQAQCAAPVNLQTTYANNVTSFDWSPVTGATSYVFELKQSWDSWAYPEWIDTMTVDSYSLVNIMQSISIDWRVKAICSNGESAYEYYSNYTVPCPQPGNPTTTNIGMTSATINWKPPVGYRTHISDFVLAYRKSGASTWTSLGHTSDSSKVISGLLANTTYEWRVTMTCPYFYSSQLTSSFTTLGCNSAGVNSSEWISTFKVGSINNNSGAEAGGYINTNTSTNLARNSNNSARIRVGNSGQFISKNYKIYIDYNNNNIFEETEIVHGPASINNTGNINFTLSIPSTAALGSHKMRVIMARTGTSITGCINGHNGETEDYLVNITGSGNKSTGMEEIAQAEQEKLTIYPNPVTDILSVQVSSASEVKIYDMVGKLVYHQQASENKMQINVSQWPSAQYVIEAIYENGHKDVVRFIKQ